MALIWQGWRRQAETCRSVFKEPSCNCLINLELRKRCGCTTLGPTLNSLKVPLKHLASDKPQSDFRTEIVNFSSVIIKRRFCVSSSSSICSFKFEFSTALGWINPQTKAWSSIHSTKLYELLLNTNAFNYLTCTLCILKILDRYLRHIAMEFALHFCRPRIVCHFNNHIPFCDSKWRWLT